MFRMITGPGEARRRRAHASARRSQLAYVDQSRDALDRRARRSGRRSPAAHDMIDARQARDELAAPTCAAFNFKGADQQKKVGHLSGGERNRVHLAKLLKSGGNLLLLDEPTNDLDVDTLRALEEALRRLRRLRRGHQPRPLVPRPHRHPHPRLRGRQPGRVVRGQLPGLRGRPACAGSAPRPTSPHRIKYKQADPVTRLDPVWRFDARPDRGFKTLFRGRLRRLTLQLRRDRRTRAARCGDPPPLPSCATLSAVASPSASLNHRNRALGNDSVIIAGYCNMQGDQ
ncbi:MAG: ATP-binding cassette domain-containing protein [Rhodopseudomonas palustris]|nr:ATP-binding cassette domain-containing protein [Rhodopseudomonas palustris]